MRGGGISLSELAEGVKKMDPVGWEKCCPRKFVGTNQYPSFEIAAVSLYTSYFMVEQLGRFPDKTSANVHRVAGHLLEKTIPILFVAREFGEAVMETLPPRDILWTEARLPHEAAVLMLPEGLISDQIGNSIPFVAYSRMKAGSTYRIFKNEVELAADTLTIFTVSSQAGPMGAPLTFEMTLNGEVAAEANISDIEYVSELNGSEDAWLRKIAQFVLTVALVVEAKPTLIQPGRMIRKPKKDRASLWEPNVLGAGFRKTKEQNSVGDTPMDGPPRAAARAHWRRGHVRRQPYGPGRMERKILWIEPVFVG
jgi:hypothetical protein